MAAKQALALTGRSVKREFIKLGYFLPRIIGLLLLTLTLSFIPILNLLETTIAFCWGARSLALRYLGYPADNPQVSFSPLQKN
jgi:CysZ protein